MAKGIFVIGVGGTGGLLVPKLAKMLNRTDIELWLIDGDVVESKNVERQPYQQFNIHEKKATALSRKVKSNYDLKVYEYTNYLTGHEIGTIAFDECYEEVMIIGCVDNHSTRILLEEQCYLIENCVYIDSANGEKDGSVFITVKDKEFVKGDFRSDLFSEIKSVEDHPTGTCNHAIENGNMQQMVINDIMANSIAMAVYDWMMNELEPGVIKVDGFERFFAPS